MDYDFSTLSPHDFELLTQDLLQQEYGLRLEGFKSGRDGGIDLRRCENRRTKLIIQCKHYVRSTFSKLKGHLEKQELPKIVKLAPKRYVLTTSMRLSAKQKDALCDILAPYCKGPADVFGAEDLNALLRRYPEVEKLHFKLWIASTSVLEAILNNDLFARKHLEVEEIRTKLSLFVPTEAVDRAAKALDSHGFCLLSGIPGIGKTTTAEMLVARALNLGWECVIVSTNATEAMRAYNQEHRQLFYYDDFLGLTSLTEKLGKNEDHELIRLIRTCGKQSTSKRLILTTRNYLLAQAIEQHEILGRSPILKANCVIELADYTQPVRAQILVNHLWFFGVKQTWCSKLVASGAARRIVDHPNYNPRLIEAICESVATEANTAEVFARCALGLLDDPSSLWRHPYQNQLSEAARELMLCFASLGNGCYLKSLRSAYGAFTSSKQSVFSEELFNRARRELEGTFIQVEATQRRRTVVYHNPSVKDFMDGVFESTPSCARSVLMGAAFYDQITAAAPFALRHEPSAAVQELILDGVRKHLFGPSAVPETDYEHLLSEVPIRPARRLLARIKSYGEAPVPVLRAGLSGLIVEYLNGGDYYGDEGKDVAQLARMARYDSVVFNPDSPVQPAAVENWLWRSLKSADDYLAMKELIEDREGEEARLQDQQKLRANFREAAQTLLDELADGGHSSSYMEDAMNEIIYAADMLGADTSTLNTEGAEAAISEARSAERDEENSRKDQWAFDRLKERAVEEKVDDILDSLR